MQSWDPRGRSHRRGGWDAGCGGRRPTLQSRSRHFLAVGDLKRVADPCASIYTSVKRPWQQLPPHSMVPRVSETHSAQGSPAGTWDATPEFSVTTKDPLPTAAKMLLSLKTVTPPTGLKHPPEILPQHQDWVQGTALAALSQTPHGEGF